MKKLLLLSALSTSFGFAQTQLQTYSVYDVNHDENVSVQDVTPVVNRAVQKTTADPQMVTAEELNAVLQKIEGELAAIRSHVGLPEPGGSTPPVASTSFASARKIMHIGETYTQEVTTTSDGTVSYLSTNTTVATVDATTGLVTAKANGESTIVATIAATASYPAASAAYTVRVEAADQHNGHEYVDLGIVVDGKKVLWAKTNIGAAKPADYGDYYAWGETETKSNYSWETYKFAVWVEGTPAVTDEDGFVITPAKEAHYEGTNIGEDIQGTQYDAAHVNWGGDWRMPTLAELDALRTQCDWRWGQMLDSDGNAHNGYKVMNKSDNSKYIFLPAAGYRDNSSLSYAGSYGDFWSSSLYSETYACELYFYSSCIDWCGGSRYGGHSVRPVCVLSE